MSLCPLDMQYKPSHIQDCPYESWPQERASSGTPQPTDSTASQINTNKDTTRHCDESGSHNRSIFKFELD